MGLDLLDNVQNLLIFVQNNIKDLSRLGRTLFIFA